MAREIENDNPQAPTKKLGVKRRGLLRFGTFVTALTGASVMSALNSESAQASPVDKTPPNTYVPIAEKGTPSGVATLDTNAKILTTQLPDLSATYAQHWKPYTAYAVGQRVVNPSGDIVTAFAAFTTGAAYDAGDWKLSETYQPTGSAFADISRFPGVDPTGVTECAAALQAAFDAVKSAGHRAYAKGTFVIASMVTLEGNCDLADATFTYIGTGTAVLVGTSKPTAYVQRIDVKLPHVIAAGKTLVGWGQVAGSVGVQISNVYTAEITIPEIRNFETGLYLYGIGQGVSYVDIALGHLLNNKRNMRFNADATGWANQNNIFGGRVSHNSAEGTVVAGTRHILLELTPSKVNNNNFFGTSFESPNVVEYHLDCAGNDNYWHGCRWENTRTGARVIWRANSIGNVIADGFGSHTIVETRETNTANALSTRARSRRVGDGAALGFAVMALENTASSSSPALRVMEAGAESVGADQTTAWAVELSAQKLRGKRSSDTNERAILDLQNGRVYVGAGNAPTTRYFGNLGTSMGFDGASIGYATDNTYDFGMSGLRPRYIRAGTAVQTGSASTALRPSAAAAGSGAMFFDTTLGKPIWSTGITWVDATGTTV